MAPRSRWPRPSPALHLCPATRRGCGASSERFTKPPPVSGQDNFLSPVSSQTSGLGSRALAWEAPRRRRLCRLLGPQSPVLFLCRTLSPTAACCCFYDFCLFPWFPFPLICLHQSTPPSFHLPFSTSSPPRIRILPGFLLSRNLLVTVQHTLQRFF